MPLPLVSCVMPTANRQRWAVQAIRYFQRQDYPNAELLILDDGNDGAQSLLDQMRGDSRIRYVRIPPGRSLGAKRNQCVELSRGDLILHWDDDDWMAPHRIRSQVEARQRVGAEVCGLSRMLFFEPSTGHAWLFDYPQSLRRWIAGGSLLYTRDFWRQSPFPDIQVGSDTQFIWNGALDRVAYLDDFQFYVAMIHRGNTSPKNCADSNWWKPWPSETVETILGSDLSFYRSPTAAKAVSVPPEYAILMVACHALEMTRIATLRTLRHSAGKNARLLVVDNASNDGTEQWLDILRSRNDIDLIQNTSNVGHGPGLELGRASTRSPYLVTLDSDAFPISDTWLEQLRERLNAGTKVTGIRHHRDYIHPSCLMIARATLDEFGVSFLNEKEQASQFDVAERITAEVKRRGFSISGLERSSQRRRGSISEPVYLGAEYESIVHHQWYTTRSAIAVGAPVDDVPQHAIDESLNEVIDFYRSDARDVAVVVGVRCRPGETERSLNAKACLWALNLQKLERWRYRIVVVEQDEAPRMERLLAPLADEYIFARNPGPYNRGWAFNIGAARVGRNSRTLCLMDADLLVPPDFLTRGLQAIDRGRKAVLPYTEVMYLTADETERAIAIRRAAPMAPFDPSGFNGQLFTTSQGGCIWVDSERYVEIGGHDERFRGWGREDREFWARLSPMCVDVLPGRILHLHHPRPPMEDQWALANQQLLEQIERNTNAVWKGPMGNLDRYAHESYAEVAYTAAPPPAQDRAGAREWENWHLWEPRRIEEIVHREQRVAAQGPSARQTLAQFVSRFGQRILDAGCGPGAMWPHFESLNPRVSWVGADVTAGMIGTAHSLFPHVPVCRADNGRLPFAGQSFDVVLLRHVLEHLPSWLMEDVLAEAMRVARRAVLIDLYVPPGAVRITTRVGEDFLETRWSENDIRTPIRNAGWGIEQKIPIASPDGSEVIWVLGPGIVEPHTDTSTEPFRFSIIMPTYRRAHTINRAVASIRTQTYQSWELIVIDNAGDAGYAFDDPRISVYRHAEQASASFARNQGLRYATGDLVCFFDDDDEMFPDYLRRFADVFAQNPFVRMVRCGMVLEPGLNNFSYATPECCLRRSFATATWTNYSTSHDQIYFKSIAAANGWSEAAGDVISIQDTLCRAHMDPHGGLRLGRL